MYVRLLVSLHLILGTSSFGNELKVRTLSFRYQFCFKCLSQTNSSYPVKCLFSFFNCFLCKLEGGGGRGGGHE